MVSFPMRQLRLERATSQSGLPCAVCPGPSGIIARRGMASGCNLTNGLGGLASAVARRLIRHVLPHNGTPSDRFASVNYLISCHETTCSFNWTELTNPTRSAQRPVQGFHKWLLPAKASSVPFPYPVHSFVRMGIDGRRRRIRGPTSSTTWRSHIASFIMSTSPVRAVAVGCTAWLLKSGVHMISGVVSKSGYPGNHMSRARMLFPIRPDPQGPPRSARTGGLDRVPLHWKVWYPADPD
jgi:hypothetical protein